MHTFGDSGAGVPAFLAKLWRLVDDPETNDLICWSKDGRSFVIQNQAKFARELLPLNYKHNNMASFIRQLNMYGFHKISSIENGGLKFDRDEMEFSHPCFKRNHPYLLEHIKRKIATTKNTDEKTALKPEAVSKVLQDVRAMRGRQDSLDSRFSVMKQENEALWREIASLRQKHAKQQQIVNKLIQFLITIVQPSRNMTGVKRTMHLMINDTPENAKLRKSSESESEAGGPVIHELGEELLDEVADTVGALNNDECASPSPMHMERPHSSISMTSQNYDYSNQSTEDLLNQMPGTPQSSNGSGGGAGVGTPSTGAGAKVPPAVIQSIHSDGSQVVYHVTEIPDAHPPLTPSPQLAVNDDNILQTPMVREEIARSQLLLKQKQSRRRKNTTSPQNAGAASAANGNSKPTTAKLPRLQESIKQEQQQQQLINHQPIQVKSEQNLDPMQFLNVYTDSYLDSPAGTPQQQQQLMSPMLNDDSQQSRQSLCYSGGAIPSPAPSPLAGNMSVMVGGQGGKTITTTAADATSSTAATNNLNNTLGLYTSDFIDNDIPSDIFEDSILSAGENSNNSNFNGKLKSQQQQQQQQQAEENFLLSTLNNGKFSAFAAANGNGNGNGLQHSNGSSQNATGGKNLEADDNAGPSTSSALNSLKNDDDNEQNMAVTQYKRGGSVVVPENMRLSTLNEVHGHLDSLQDELDTLKELLRGDNYSLDNNMLMSLFNDSDILGPYGLQMPMDGGPNEKKGSELIPAYQPSYDLSDIMSINNDSNLDAGDVDVASPSSSNMARSNSVLNTPYHE